MFKWLKNDRLSVNMYDLLASVIYFKYGEFIRDYHKIDEYSGRRLKGINFKNNAFSMDIKGVILNHYRIEPDLKSSVRMKADLFYDGWYIGKVSTRKITRRDAFTDDEVRKVSVGYYTLKEDCPLEPEDFNDFFNKLIEIYKDHRKKYEEEKREEYRKYNEKMKSKRQKSMERLAETSGKSNK